MTEIAYAMSDIHGHRESFERLLQVAGLVSETGTWTGGRSALWLLGDYTDRGPDGVGVIDRIMQLQEQAAAAGGEVVALLGNHEVLLLGAYHFRGRGAAVAHDTPEPFHVFGEEEIEQNEPGHQPVNDALWHGVGQNSCRSHLIAFYQDVSSIDILNIETAA